MKVLTGSLQEGIKKAKKFKGETIAISIQKRENETCFVKTMENVEFIYKLDVECGDIVQTNLNNQTIALLEKIKENYINIELDKITTEKRKINIYDVAPELVNEIEVGEIEESIIIDPVEYKQLCQVIDVTAKDETRPILKGVSFKNNKVVGLDGYRLYLREGSFKLDNEYVIEGNTLKSTLGLINKNTKQVKISFNNRHAVIEIDDSKAIIKLMEGNYINYESLINDSNNSIVTLDKEELKEEIDFLLSDKESNKVVVFDFEKEKAILTDKLNAEIKLDKYKLEGEEIKIGFNPTYLKDSLKNHNDNIKMELINSVSPMILRSENIKGLDLILPVRIPA